MNSSRMEFTTARVMHKNLYATSTNQIRAMLFTAEINKTMIKYQYKLMTETYLSLSDTNMEVALSRF